ncbi:MAG: hypothetical protein LIO91_03705 [Bacteroidales bacterium]|nr:hypothetical protein [Bacteroidales bacterium]
MTQRLTITFGEFTEFAPLGTEFVYSGRRYKCVTTTSDVRGCTLYVIYDIQRDKHVLWEQGPWQGKRPAIFSRRIEVALDINLK